MTFRLSAVDPPKLGPTLAPHDIGRTTLADRIGMLRARMAEVQLDVLAVYGDREHFGNIHYLTGFDPRFEEALFVLHADGEMALLLGNECMGYAEISPLGIKRLLCQSFSLLGQSRRTAPRLDAVLAKAGLKSGQRVGAIGWKYFLEVEADHPSTTLDLPSFIADALRAISAPAPILNATALLMHPETGLRTRVELEQILTFAPACQAASHGIFHAIIGLREGERESDIATRFAYDGRPLSYYPIVTSGERTRYGLASPSHRVISTGDRVFMAMGGWGANTVRGGYALATTEELSAIDNGYLEDVVSPYLDMVSAWYGAIRPGASAGDINDLVLNSTGGRVDGIALNPGHHIHVDEWVSSPFEQGSTIALASGMMLQMDIIPVIRDGGFGTNAEDGIILADGPLRDAIARAAPDLWAAITRRRKYMRESIGFELDDSVLPLSDIQGWLPPLLMAPGFAMTRVA